MQQTLYPANFYVDCDKQPQTLYPANFYVDCDKQPTVTWGQVSVEDDLGQDLNALFLLEGHNHLGLVVPDIVMKQKGLSVPMVWGC